MREVWHARWDASRYAVVAGVRHQNARLLLAVDAQIDLRHVPADDAEVG
jgi:hypothetical protein